MAAARLVKAPSCWNAASTATLAGPIGPTAPLLAALDTRLAAPLRLTPGGVRRLAAVRQRWAPRRACHTRQAPHAGAPARAERQCHPHLRVRPHARARLSETATDSPGCSSAPGAAAHGWTSRRR